MPVVINIIPFYCYTYAGQCFVSLGPWWLWLFIYNYILFVQTLVGVLLRIFITCERLRWILNLDRLLFNIWCSTEPFKFKKIVLYRSLFGILNTQCILCMNWKVDYFEVWGKTFDFYYMVLLFEEMPIGLESETKHNVMFRWASHSDIIKILSYIMCLEA